VKSWRWEARVWIRARENGSHILIANLAFEWNGFLHYLSSEEFESPCLTFLAIEVSRICSKLGVDFSSANIIHTNKGLIYEANYNSISWKVLWYYEVRRKATRAAFQLRAWFLLWLWLFFKIFFILKYIKIKIIFHINISK
jgi:hypothetical protein